MTATAGSLGCELQWGCAASTAGNPSEWHSRGHGFDPHRLHQECEEAATLAMLSPLSREANVGMWFTKATHCEKSLEYARPPRMTTLFAPALRTACRSEAMSATL